ncbi:NAD(+)/NADH kinase [Rosettibacter firmus]|uniref:NAD(+)/NADH kinase n=1 Tax=Rosettibacter firmus TaxID=3111522 RepID=UPI00336C214D
MILGIIPNITKTDILKTIEVIVEELQKYNLGFFICDSMLKKKNEFSEKLNNCSFLPLKELINKSDIIISIGGDGTMLNTAYEVRNDNKPIIGVNLGKLGFLAEFDVESFKNFIPDIISKNYTIENRIALIGNVNNKEELYAINDIVIDKGSWAKMIEITIKIDDDYVSTFSADGIIIATPTGSTGYSLSTGGPIITPKSNVITLSPIAPHTLTMRPLVISSNQKITIIAQSQFGKIHISCDGQRSNIYDSPSYIFVEKSKKDIQLAHSNNTSYFEILRNKLFWGLDIRKFKNHQ